jgi:hypothetical protein
MSHYFYLSCHFNFHGVLVKGRRIKDQRNSIPSGYDFFSAFGKSGMVIETRARRGYSRGMLASAEVA